MRKLTPDEYSTVLPLLETIQNQAVYALAVIDGTQQGSVYVNEGKQITSAFITSSGGFYGVAGDETNDAFVQDVIQYMNDESNHPDFLLWVSLHRGLGEQYGCLSYQNSQKISRTYYRFNQERFIKSYEEFVQSYGKSAITPQKPLSITR